MDLQLTTKANEALAAAARTAAADGHPQIEPAHVLKALAEQADTTTPALLEAAGTTVAGAVSAADRILAALPSVSGSSVPTPQLSRAGAGRAGECPVADGVDGRHLHLDRPPAAGARADR